MDSWREPLALTRVWCLLEVFTAMEHGAELAMCFSSATFMAIEAGIETEFEVQAAIDAYNQQLLTIE